MRTSSLTGETAVSQGEREGGQSACCLHSDLCEIPLHVYVPMYFSWKRRQLALWLLNRGKS